MLFNTARQEVAGLAQIRELYNENSAMGNVVDLTSLYTLQVKKVSKAVKLHPSRSITIQDEWTNGVKTSFQWVTVAKATLQVDGVLLEQNGKSLKQKIETTDSTTKPVIVIEDLLKEKNPQDFDDQGVSRIIFKAKTPANNAFSRKVSAIPLF